MNPPFSHQQDIDHVMKAYELLSPNSILVSVMSVSFKFRLNKKSEESREFLETVGTSQYDILEERSRRAE